MSSAPPRQMSMIAFLQAQNCSNLPGSWRHPSSMSDFITPDYYQRIGRVLEDGKFHMAFFDDRLAMPDIYTNDHAQTVAHGVRAVKMDPVTIATTMADGNTPLYIGSRADQVTAFQGSMDAVRIYDRALSAGDVAELYAAVVPEPGAVAVLALVGGVVAARVRPRRSRS